MSPAEKYTISLIEDLNVVFDGEIDVGRIRGGLGGDIFCIHKNESTTL